MDPIVSNHMNCFGALCQKYKKYDVEVLTLRQMLSRDVIDKQECFPAGCVPTAAVATTWCQYRGGLGVLPAGMPSPCGQTNASENIPFPCNR